MTRASRAGDEPLGVALVAERREERRVVGRLAEVAHGLPHGAEVAGREVREASSVARSPSVSVRENNRSKNSALPSAEK